MWMKDGRLMRIPKEYTEEDLFDPWVKITYKSEPIGEYGIVLYLTTYDVDYDGCKVKNTNKVRAYNGDINVAATLRLNGINMERYRTDVSIATLEHNINEYVNKFYRNEIERLNSEIQKLKVENKKSSTPLYFGDITNAGEVRCGIVKGDITNCKKVICNKIEGDVVNCNVEYGSK